MKKGIALLTALFMLLCAWAQAEPQTMTLDDAAALIVDREYDPPVLPEGLNYRTYVRLEVSRVDEALEEKAL